MTRPGRVRDMSRQGHIFRHFWASTWDKFEKLKKGNRTFLEMSQNGQDRDILSTRPVHVWDVTGTCPTEDTFLGKFEKGHRTSFRN